MESDAKIVSFRDSLCEVAEQLTTIDVKQLKFLCSDRIPSGNLEEMDGFDLMQALHDRRIIFHNNLDFLLECLTLIGRLDVVYHLCSDTNRIDSLSCDLSKYKSNAGLSSFKIMLFDLADNITEVEVKKLILYLDGQPGISKGKLKLCISGFDLLKYLMNVQYVHPKDLGNLNDFVKRLNRKDLLEKIETYSEIIRQEVAGTEQQQDEIIRQEVAGTEQRQDREIMKQEVTSTETAYWEELINQIPPEKHYIFCQNLGISTDKFKMFKDNIGKLLINSYKKKEFTVDDVEKYLMKLNLQNPLSTKKNKPTMETSGMHLEKYTMTAKPRGICLIINNENFQPSTSLKKRRGSQKDEDELKAVFESFFFEVEVAKDLTKEKIEEKLRDVAARDHKNYDCFVCCILSHGVRDAVYGVDGVELPYSRLILPFKPNQCHGLTGKPKLFFIQACQGKSYQMGVENVVEMDGNQHSTIPNEADFLLACATVKEYVSFRSINTGSWFIQALCQVLKENAKSLDLTDMLLIVNNEVSQLEGKLKDSEQVKQVPAPLVTLRKKVFFFNDSD